MSRTPSYIQRHELTDGTVLFQHHYVYDRLGNQLFKGDTIVSLQYPNGGGCELWFTETSWGLIGSRATGGCQANQIHKTFWMRKCRLTLTQSIHRRIIVVRNRIGHFIESNCQKAAVALYHELKQLGHQKVAEVVWKIGYRGLGGLGWRLSR